MANYLVITGGSQGIGDSTIGVFQQHGWHAINISRTNCHQAGVININIDLSLRHWADANGTVIRRAVEDAEQICLVHNAAALEKDSIDTLSEDAFTTVLNVNVVAPVLLNQILLPLMKPGSSIFYLGSTLSEQAVKQRASYVTTKHASIGLMRATCVDLMGRGIHTACICPGFVDTNMLRNHVTDMPAFMSFIESKVVAQRLIQPKEIAEYIYFCATHPVVNGAVLHANLGQVTT